MNLGIVPKLYIKFKFLILLFTIPEEALDPFLRFINFKNVYCYYYRASSNHRRFIFLKFDFSNLELANRNCNFFNFLNSKII